MCRERGGRGRVRKRRASAVRLDDEGWWEAMP